MRLILNSLILVIFSSTAVFAGGPADKTMTYQGRLDDAGTAANGQYDFLIELHESESGNTPIGSPNEILDVTVADGYFTVELDYGEEPFFSQGPLWLEIGVRVHSGGGSYTTLSPRQKLTRPPFALTGWELRNFPIRRVACEWSACFDAPEEYICPGDKILAGASIPEFADESTCGNTDDVRFYCCSIVLDTNPF